MARPTTDLTRSTNNRAAAWTSTKRLKSGECRAASFWISERLWDSLEKGSQEAFVGAAGLGSSGDIRVGLNGAGSSLLPIPVRRHQMPRGTPSPLRAPRQASLDENDELALSAGESEEA